MNILSQEQLNNIIAEYKEDCERVGFQDDWWTAVPAWDVNVHEIDEEESPYKMGITLYRIDENGKPDYNDFHSNVTEFDASEFDDISMLKKKIERKEEEYNEYLNEFKDAHPLTILNEIIWIGNGCKTYPYDDLQKVEDLAKLLKKELEELEKSVG